MKIALGTVQFGLNYGAFNRSGAPSAQTVAEILQVAARHGIRTLDTARAYGASEKVLGEALTSSTAWRILTKCPPLEVPRAEDIKRVFTESLTALRRDFVDGYMLHRAKDLLSPGGQEIWETLVRLRESGRIGKIGISSYSGEEALRILKKYPIELVQFPLNILDQRLLKSGTLDFLKSKNVEIHARSLFLQGLILNKVESLHSYFDPMKPHLEVLAQKFKESNITALEVCLGFVRDLETVDAMVVGVDTPTQLQQIIEAYQGVPKLALEGLAWEGDESYLNPANWKL